MTTVRIPKSYSSTSMWMIVLGVTLVTYFILKSSENLNLSAFFFISKSRLWVKVSSFYLFVTALHGSYFKHHERDRTVNGFHSEY